MPKFIEIVHGNHTISVNTDQIVYVQDNGEKTVSGKRTTIAMALIRPDGDIKMINIKESYTEVMAKIYES